MDKIPMTKEGYDVLMAELHTLKNKERPAIIEAIAVARDHGDLKENAEYHSAREKQGFIEGRIAELETVTGRAEIIDYLKFSGSKVKFGATIDLVEEETEAEVTYKIVGHYEADISLNLLSLQAPIARALIGKEVGDSVSVRSPGGQKDYEILDVRFEKIEIKK